MEEKRPKEDMRSRLSSSWRAAGAAAAILSLALLAGGCRTASRRAPAALTSPQTGIASWYGPGFHGRTTSNRETYDMYDATAAHNSLPFGTRVRVTNLDNGKSAVVRINDRGPFVGGRIIDLSYSAAYLLDMIGPGTAPVRLEVMKLRHPPRGLRRFRGPGRVVHGRGQGPGLGPNAGSGFRRRSRARRPTSRTGSLYRVRIPARTRSEAEETVGRLSERGFPALILERS